MSFKRDLELICFVKEVIEVVVVKLGSKQGVTMHFRSSQNAAKISKR